MLLKKMFLVFIIVVLSSACETETLVTKVDKTNTGQRADGVLFSLPETLVVAEVPVSRISSSPGAFHEWTEFFYPELTSDDYITEENSKFKIGAPTFTTRGQTDPDNVYMAHIKAKQFETKTLLLEFNDDGIIARTETSSKDESIDIITSGLKTAATIAAPLLPFGAGGAAVGTAGFARDKKSFTNDEEYFKSQLTARALALYLNLDDDTRKKLRNHFGYPFLLYVVEATKAESNDAVGIEFFFTLNDHQWEIVEKLPHSTLPCSALPLKEDAATDSVENKKENQKAAKKKKAAGPAPAPAAPVAAPPAPPNCLASNTLAELARALKVYNKIQQLRLKRQDYLNEPTAPQLANSTHLEFRLKELDNQIKTLEQAYFLGTSSETASTTKFEFKPSALFAPGDFPGGLAFATKLNTPADAMSTLLHGRLTPSTQALLAADVAAGVFSIKLEESLATDLNAAMKGAAFGHVAGVSYRQETVDLLNDPNTAGADLVRLHRLMIEDAYAEVARNRQQNVFRYAAGGAKPGICQVTSENSGIFKVLWPKNLAGSCHEANFLLEAGDFRDLMALKDRLTPPAVPPPPPPAPAPLPKPDNYIYGQLGGGTKGLIGGPATTPQQKATLRATLITDLNAIINSGASIYPSADFSGVDLSSETIKLLNTPGADTKKLNRLLLEDIFADEIFRVADWTPRQLAVRVDLPPPGMAGTVQNAALSQPGKRGFPYRVPAMTMARLIDDGVERGRSDVRIAQFGPVKSLPANLGGRRSSYKITYYDASGAIKIFDMSADALIQKSNVTDVTDAVTTLRDAETTRLKRETEILKAKKDKLDAEKALRDAQKAAEPSPLPSPSPSPE
jgi:hypothetical protein